RPLPAGSQQLGPAGGAPRVALRHGGQPGLLVRRPLLGLPPAPQPPRLAARHLLQLRPGQLAAAATPDRDPLEPPLHRPPMTDAAGAAPREATLGEALREWTKAILVAIAAWLLLRTFLLEAFRIPSSSMENTLRPGDHLFVNKAIYGPEIPGLGLRLPAWREPARGDVLVFDSVEERDMKVV